MAGKRREKVTERQITGLKYFDKLAPLLERLHDDGCARDRAGNRVLHYDQYCMLMLLYLFNPGLSPGVRGLQQASELAKVQKKLGCPLAAARFASRKLPACSILSGCTRSCPNWEAS